MKSIQGYHLSPAMLASQFDFVTYESQVCSCAYFKLSPTVATPWSRHPIRALEIVPLVAMHQTHQDLRFRHEAERMDSMDHALSRRHFVRRHM